MQFRKPVPWIDWIDFGIAGYVCKKRLEGLTKKCFEKKKKTNIKAIFTEKVNNGLCWNLCGKIQQGSWLASGVNTYFKGSSEFSKNFFYFFLSNALGDIPTNISPNVLVRNFQKVMNKFNIQQHFLKK